MASEWQEISLGDLFTVKHGFAFKGEFFTDTPQRTVLVTPGNFSIGGGFQNQKPKYYNGKVPNDYILKPGSVVITMTDLSKESDTLGISALIPFDNNIWLHNQRIGLVRFNPDYKTDPIFLNYLLRTHEYRSWIIGSASGTTVKHTAPSRIHAYQCVVPPIEEQKAIALILGSLDDKIELNRQMNVTLEAMAQALFKSWFVDFDPVIDNALAAGNPIPDELEAKAAARQALGDARKPLPEDIRSLFPNAFLFTEEMGWIPEGWEVSSMFDATEFREGPGILAKDFHKEGVPLIRLAGLKNGVSLLDGCNYLDPTEVDKKWSHFRLIKGDILLSTSASLGRVAEVDDYAVGAIPYTGIIGFRPIANKTVQRFLLHYLTSFQFQEQVTVMGVGSVLNHFGPTHIKKMHMLLPSISVQEKFSILTTPQDFLSAQWLKQSYTLAKLRDTLLPKLLSGELRIPEAERLVEEAI